MMLETLDVIFSTVLRSIAATDLLRPTAIDHLHGAQEIE
jgi:hypothetical protein